MNVKHAGKTYPIEVDTAAPGSAFKESIYQTTGIPTGKLAACYMSLRWLNNRAYEGDGQGRDAQGATSRAEES